MASAGPCPPHRGSWPASGPGTSRPSSSGTCSLSLAWSHCWPCSHSGRAARSDLGPRHPSLSLFPSLLQQSLGSSSPKSYSPSWSFRWEPQEQPLAEGRAGLQSPTLSTPAYLLALSSLPLLGVPRCPTIPSASCPLSPHLSSSHLDFISVLLPCLLPTLKTEWAEGWPLKRHVHPDMSVTFGKGSLRT